MGAPQPGVPIQRPVGRFVPFVKENERCVKRSDGLGSALILVILGRWASAKRVRKEQDTKGHEQPKRVEPLVVTSGCARVARFSLRQDSAHKARLTHSPSDCESERKPRRMLLPAALWEAAKERRYPQVYVPFQKQLGWPAVVCNEPYRSVDHANRPLRFGRKKGKPQSGADAEEVNREGKRYAQNPKPTVCPVLKLGPLRLSFGSVGCGLLHVRSRACLVPGREASR